MLFIGVALVVAIGLAFAISTDAGTLIGLDQQSTAQLIAGLAVLIVLAGGLFTRRRRLGEMLGNLVVWCAIFVVVLGVYSYRADLTRFAGRILAELTPGAAVVDVQSGTATFRRSFGGSFRINAVINGHEAHMIFDTGASAVVLTRQDAEAAGLPVDDLAYIVPVKTANGTGRAALVELDSVSVGDIDRKQIRAYVSEAGALETSLLGMTFLETLSGYSVSQDALILAN
jgi:aspartyl protease family protein